MGANLHLVHPASRYVAPSFWTEERVARLAAMNAAVRVLRELEFRILHLDLDARGYDKPAVEIERIAAQSIVPLLERAEEHFWRTRDGIKHGFAFLLGAVVMWEELS